MCSEYLSFSDKEITSRAIANNQPNPWPGFQDPHECTGVERAFGFHFLVSSVRAVDVLTDVSVSWININAVGRLCLRHKTFKIQPQYANEVEL